MLQTNLIDEIASMEDPDAGSDGNILVEIRAISDTKVMDMSHYPNSFMAVVMTRKGELISAPLNCLTILKKVSLKGSFLLEGEIDETLFHV